MGANHSHGHSGGSAVPSSRATVWATLAVIVPLALVTLTALVWMWPGPRRPLPNGRSTCSG
ncbi:hypothetical protein ACFQX6_09100 [Streptosporangium lutulentum]